MSDLTDRARGILADTAPSKTVTVGQMIALRGVVADLLAEVERLAATIDRIEDLADGWVRSAADSEGHPANAWLAALLRGVLAGEVAE